MLQYTFNLFQRREQLVEALILGVAVNIVRHTAVERLVDKLTAKHEPKDQFTRGAGTCGSALLL